MRGIGELFGKRPAESKPTADQIKQQYLDVPIVDLPLTPKTWSREDADKPTVTMEGNSVMLRNTEAYKGEGKVVAYLVSGKNVFSMESVPNEVEPKHPFRFEMTSSGSLPTGRVEIYFSVDSPIINARTFNSAKWAFAFDVPQK